MTPTNSPPHHRKRPTRSYPLISLFLLMAVAASLAAQLAIVRNVDLPVPELARGALLSGIMGMLLGLAVGLHHYWRIEGALFGLVVGFVVGAMAGPMTLVAEKAPLATIGVAAGSGITLILFTTAYQMSNARDRNTTDRSAQPGKAADHLDARNSQSN